MEITKEEVKKLIISAVKSDIVIKHLSGDATFLDATKALKKIFSAVDQIEPNHPKVKLPREVGEELDTWIANNQDGYGGRISDLCGSLWDEIQELSATATFANKSEENYFKVIDAYRYGWTVEKPKLYVVFVPHTNRRIVYAKGVDGLDTMDVAFGNIPDGRFTQSEIDDNDLGGCEKTEVPNED